jgi:ankyrin repeat protein
MGESENEKFLKSLRTLIKKRDIEKIKSLISNPRFDVNIRDLTQDLQTPLMKLCYSEINDTNLMTIMDLLLDRNADLNTQDSLGRTAVMHACIARRTTIADYIISDPTTRLEMFDFDGNSVLTHAVKSADFIIAKRILDHPAGPPLLEIYNSNGKIVVIGDFLGEGETVGCSPQV